MKIGLCTETPGPFDTEAYDALILPFGGDELHVSLPEEVRGAVLAALKEKRLKAAPGSLYVLTLCVRNAIMNVVLFRTGDFGASTNRELFLRYAGAIKRCRELEARNVAVLLDNTPDMQKRPELFLKLCELPFLVSYDFRTYKTGDPGSKLESFDFVTAAPGFGKVIDEAIICGESVQLARDLTNTPSAFMTPKRFAEEALKLGNTCGFEVSVLGRDAIELQEMHAFLAVARAAADEPRLIVMRYRGGASEAPTLALVGKGVMFDSGGYAIKSSMATMHDDMGGAAAVLGAIRCIALNRIGINVVGVVPACRNMISPDAFVPGDIVRSKAGKTIQVLNTDAEGRLLLADGITYAIREEGADEIIDIATLTGAAKQAVGNRSAAVLSNNDALYEAALQASVESCEKIWRLDLDGELRHILDSPVADIANSHPGQTAGGGTIVASLFLREFVEDKPWLHIDMASVNWATEEGAYFRKGATGYGVSLLYSLAKIKSRELKLEIPGLLNL